MKQIASLFLILVVNISYSQPDKIDPYFAETRDTVSNFGPRSITRNILEDKNGNIWFATWQGIMMYDGKVFTNYTLKEKLIHFHVYSILEDRSGNIWFGTIRGGAYKYDPSAAFRPGGKTFTLYTSNDGLADDLIGCMMEDKSGNIWFGTDGGVSRLDTSVSVRANVKSAVTLSGLTLTTKKGINNYTTDNGLCGNRVNSIIQDRTGKIWIGTRSGVCCYDPSAPEANSGQVALSSGGKSFSDFRIKPGVPFTNVRCIKEDKSGKIWIGGQEGLYCYDPSLGTDEKSLIQLKPNFICYIFEDKAENLWISTGEWNGKGMSLYKYDKKTFTLIIEKKTSGDEQVFEIMEDKNGNIWFGTMNGPCRYDPSAALRPGGRAFTYFRK